MKGSEYRFLVTCEHGGNRVPVRYEEIFNGRQQLLDSHRGWDAGALFMARYLARKLDTELLYTDVTRLLIDTNRSPHHRRLFSEITRDLPDDLKQEIMKKYYFPYRDKVEDWISSNTRQGRTVIHFSAHSFTPELMGQTRTADLGLLYDPKRKPEKILCRKLQWDLSECIPELRIRRNYPYRGGADGFTTYLRKQFPGEQYVGIEIEINQKLVVEQNKSLLQLLPLLHQSIVTASRAK